MFKIYNDREHFWQWDINQKIIVDTPCDVHFCNVTQEDTLVVEPKKDEQGKYIADVPNILLQSAVAITVYAYVNNGDEAYTKVSAKFDVKRRNRPSDYVYTETEVRTWDELDERMKALEKGNAPTISEVTLLASAWVGDDSPYSQVVEIDGVTENSQVDLTPSVAQLAVFHHKDLTFVTENAGGVVTVYALGDKPLNDYTIQVTITEVHV